MKKDTIHESVQRSKDSFLKYSFLSILLLLKTLRLSPIVIVSFLLYTYSSISNYEIFSSSSSLSLYSHSYFVKNIKKEISSIKKPQDLFVKRVSWPLLSIMIPMFFNHFIFFKERSLARILMQELSISFAHSIRILSPKQFEFPKKYGLCCYHSKNPYNLDYGFLFFGVGISHTPFILERTNGFVKIKKILGLYESVPVTISSDNKNKKANKQKNKEEIEKTKLNFQQTEKACFVFFPEGTNHKEGVGSFYDGGFSFCRSCEIPILPVLIMMTDQLDVHIEFLPLCSSSTSKDEIKKQMEIKYKEYHSSYTIIN